MTAPVDGILALRPAAGSDAQDLFGLMALCFAEYPGCFVDPHDDLRDLRAPGGVFGTNGAFWVLEDERGRVCACVTTDFPDGDIAELHRLYVCPDCRARGLGWALVRHAERFARESGATRMVFWSDTRFTNAHRLYRRLGYDRMAGERALGDISASVEYRFEKDLRSRDETA